MRIPTKELNRIVRDSPGHVLDVIATVMDSLCFKIGASDEERIKCIRKVRDRDVGYLFENAEHMSLVEERQRTADALQRAEDAEQRANEAEQRAAEAEQKAAKAEKEATEAKQKVNELIKQLMSRGK